MRRKGGGSLGPADSRDWHEGYSAAIRAVLGAANNSARFGLVARKQTQRRRLKAAVYKFLSEFDQRGGDPAWAATYARKRGV
jgi:hypothetical protein